MLAPFTFIKLRSSVSLNLIEAKSSVLIPIALQMCVIVFQE